jgi:hypothetical protein
MGRARGAPIRRLEFTHFREDDPTLAELEAEAAARDVSVQQHIYDILKARWLARRGRSFEELLWTPGAPAAVVETPAPSIASAAASAWLDMQEG